MTKRQRDLLKALVDHNYTSIGLLDLIDPDVNWLINAGLIEIYKISAATVAHATTAGFVKYHELAAVKRGT